MLKHISFFRFILTFTFSLMLLSALLLLPAHAEAKAGALKLASQPALCLDLAANKTGVKLISCNGSKSQSWYYIEFSGGIMIKNGEKGDDYCLRSYANNSVKMDPCNGSGFSSSRTWYNSFVFGSNVQIRNKYTNDLGRKDYFLKSDNGNILLGKVNSDEEKAWKSEYPLPEQVLTQTLGNKKVALLITHYEGDKPANAEKVRQAVFGNGHDFESLVRFVSLSSRNKLSLTGDMFTDINLGQKPTDCNTNTIRSLIADKAKEKGINLSQYDYVFTELTDNKKCNYAGLAASPGNWIMANASGQKYWMWAHEFGHNLGFQHTRAFKNCNVKNNTLQLDSSCTDTGSGLRDISDTMGGGGGHLYPVNYQYLKGWVTSDRLPLAGNHTARYTLPPVWQEGNGVQGLRILRTDGSFMVLEYRQPKEGFEDWPQGSPVVNGVTVRTYRVNGNIVVNTLVDTTPGSHPGSQDTEDAQLMPGRSLYDSLSERLVTVESADKNGAVVVVTSARGQ